MRNVLQSSLIVFLSFFIIATLSIDVLASSSNVRTVDFLSLGGLKVNGAGPLLVTADNARNRIVLVNTNTSSVSLIDGGTGAVVNIPVETRVPQYLKMEALTIDKHTGNIYIIGNKSLHIVFPASQTAVTAPTGEQYEMAAVDEKNGTAYLVGRESKHLTMVRLGSPKPVVKHIPWVEKTEKMINLNQTPPPPIRKVVCDASLRKVIAIDGYTSTLYIFSADTGKLLKKRKLAITGGIRWHWAGYNETAHHLYAVVETAERKVIEALKLDIVRGKDIVVPLPGLTEGVGINYSAERDEIYIPYDNHPSVHVVDFKNNGSVTEVKIPTYGNDASAVDERNARLYVASWGYGEVEVIDLTARKLIKRIRGVGIIPHMFNMTLHPENGTLIIPIGATAVNGSFGAALTVLDPVSETKGKIYTGWSPTALVEMKTKDGFLVFNSEDQAAEVTADGTIKTHPLPPQCSFINNAVPTPSGNIYASYGPHQSYWPVVYIWAARSGILGIDPQTMSFYDRRIPRMAHRMALDKDGVFYALQNNWGGEKQFLITLPDEIRSPNQGDMRLELEDTVLRETTQRILRYDKDKHWLYIARVGESDEEPGILQIYDLNRKKTLLTYPTGLTPTDLVFDHNTVYIANFDSDTITAIDKNDFSIQKFDTGSKPFKLAILNDTLYCIDHNDNTLRSFGKEPQTHTLPYPGKPGNLFGTGKRLIITSHSPNALHILAFDPAGNTLTLLHNAAYPYGETTVDTANSAFYMRGQFADGIFELNQIKQDKKGRLWITDYLSGKLYIINAPGGQEPF